MLDKGLGKMIEDQAAELEDKSGRAASGRVAPIWIAFALVLLTVAGVGTVSLPLCPAV